MKIKQANFSEDRAETQAAVFGENYICRKRGRASVRFIRDYAHLEKAEE